MDNTIVRLFSTTAQTRVTAKSLAEAALWYAQNGFPVFPCYPDKKIPLTKHGFKDATADLAQVEDWWAKHPKANIAMPTGPASGRLVVDIDPRNGGFESLAALERKYGPLPDTAEAYTPSGGRHLDYLDTLGYSLPPQLASGVDLKGVGGYVLLPPSFAKTESNPGGGFYHWKDPRGREALLCPAELPEWAIELIHSYSGSKQKFALSEEGAKWDDRKRNTKLTSLAGHMRRAGFSREAIEQALLIENQLHYDPPLPELEVAQIAKSISSYAPASEQGWAELIPFNQYEPEPIPENALPDWAGEMAHAVAANTETPFDLSGLLTLGVVSSCTAGKVVVSPEPAYFEPTNLYVCAAGEPGTRKTAVFNALLNPLLDWEDTQARLLEPEQKRKASERKILELQIAKLSREAAKADEPKAEFEKIHQLEEKLPVVPLTPRLFCEDCTPEALALEMAKHKERMAVFSDEGGLFDVLTGLRYSGNSGGTSNLDLLLKAHSGSPVRVNRVDPTRPPIRMNHPCLTIAVSPQPDVLESLKNKPGFRGRGLLARFLYGLPASLVGYRPGRCPPVPEATKYSFKTGVQDLLNWVPEKALVLRFSPDGYAIWKDFQMTIEQHFRDGGLLSSLKDWGGKLAGAAARLAGVLHAITPAFAEKRSVEIQESTVSLAVELATSLIFHARAAFALMERDPEIENAQKIANWIVKRNLDPFDVRDCFRAHQARFKRVDAMAPALKLLIDHGYIRRTSQGSTGGRPASDLCEVNPALFAMSQEGT